MKDSGGLTPTVDSPETFDLLKDLSSKDQEGLAALTMQGKLSYLDPHASVRVDTVNDEQGIAQVTILSGAWIGQKRWVPAVCIQSPNK